MNVIDKTYVRFEDGITRGGTDFSHDRLQAKDTSVIQKLTEIHNTPLPLSTCISLPDDLSVLSNITACSEDYSSFPLRRSHAIPLPVLHYPEVLASSSILFYQRLNDEFRLDAENYLYVGSLQQNCILHQGITLDDVGNLLLIKGKSKGLLKYLWQKCHGTKVFYCAPVALDNWPYLKFERLCVNRQGQLIAKVKNVDLYYDLVLSTKMNTKHFSIDD